MTAESLPNIRCPAPHRGFNAKAREVLLDPEKPLRYGMIDRFFQITLFNFKGLDRTGSDDEFRRKLNGIKLMRTDSEATNTSQKSHDSTHSCQGILLYFSLLKLNNLLQLNSMN